MKVFVWSYIDHATDSYHSSGGVVVFAETIERARELAAAAGAQIGKNEAADEVRDTTGDEACYIMPDAECC